MKMLRLEPRIAATGADLFDAKGLVREQAKYQRCPQHLSTPFPMGTIKENHG